VALRHGDSVEERSVNSTTPAPPCTIVIFGAAGDLTRRLLIPAIYNLTGTHLLDDRLTIVGADHHDKTAETWGNELSEALHGFTKEAGAEFHPDSIDEARWQWIAQRLDYQVVDFSQAADFEKLKDRLTAKGGGNVIFYLAVSARFFGTIVDNLASAGLLHESDGAFRRLAIEKPFGADLPSAKALNAQILNVASESQIFRLDHFLGKEPVQGIMPLRFSNGLFEPMWDRASIDSVQITAAETLGIGTRGGFYDATGALRDMVPNHLFSLLTMVAMEPPGSYDAEAVRNEKVKLLQALRPIAPEDAARGQYAAGAVDGTSTLAYRSENRVAPDSRTETYAALAVNIDNRRWSGVPFYLRTGKRLSKHLTTIAIAFRPAAQRQFSAAPEIKPSANVLTLGIAPDQGFTLAFSAKAPGPTLTLGDVHAGFAYTDFFEEPPAVGYETLLYHIMLGNTLLFQREDMVDASWAAVQPVLDAWGASHEALPQYDPGSAGPATADALLARDGRAWLPLT
jgi:glucose-6-phosphate 1-dehydrogenase